MHTNVIRIFWIYKNSCASVNHLGVVMDIFKERACERMLPSPEGLRHIWWSHTYLTLNTAMVIYYQCSNLPWTVLALRESSQAKHCWDRKQSESPGLTTLNRSSLKNTVVHIISLNGEQEQLRVQTFFPEPLSINSEPVHCNLAPLKQDRQQRCHSFIQPLSMQLRCRKRGGWWWWDWFLLLINRSKLLPFFVKRLI